MHVMIETDVPEREGGTMNERDDQMTEATIEYDTPTRNNIGIGVWRERENETEEYEG